MERERKIWHKTWCRVFWKTNFSELFLNKTQRNKQGLSVISRKIHISTVSVSFNKDLWFAGWFTHTFKNLTLKSTFKQQGKNAWTHPHISQHFLSWKTGITHLQELLAKADAVKFHLKRSKNKNFISPQVLSIYLFYLTVGSIVPAGSP